MHRGHRFPRAARRRIVQGISTGIVLPTMYAAIMRVFPPHKIGAANGVAGLVIMFAPVIGPTLAGALIGALSCARSSRCSPSSP